jgi:hypothetical protein
MSEKPYLVFSPLIEVKTFFSKGIAGTVVGEQVQIAA